MIPTIIVKANPRRNLAAEEIERQDGQERRPGGDDGSRQRLVDAVVDHLLQRLAALGALVLADAVEDDDGVVHRVTGDGENRRDHVQRQVVVEEHQERHRDDDVVEGGDDRAEAEVELEPQPDVDEDCQPARPASRKSPSAAGPCRPPGRRFRC
jgi:hypothetical protein